MTQREAVIVEAVRTPVGRRGGRLKDWHPVDLLAQTLAALVQRTGIDPGKVDDVIVGCVSQVGEQSLNVGRNAVLAALSLIHLQAFLSSEPIRSVGYYSQPLAAANNRKYRCVLV